jgi:hypothetical protein
MAEMTDYIKIESYLKDVPDSFLMKEIQQATGEYPPVLIVAEYNRRKRMRNAAEGQQVGEPKSIVEDIKQEAGLMSAPGAMQTLAARDINQMGPPPEEMRPMPQQMPQQMMPQQMMPMGMAGGGLVAFEQGGPIRAQAGLFADPTQFISEPGTPLQFKVRDYFTGGVYNEMAELQKAGFTDAQISQMSPEQRTQVVQSTRQESKGVPSGADLEKRFAPAMAAPTAAAPGAAPGVAPGAATKPPPAAGGLGAFKPGALPSAQPVVDAIQALRDQTKMPTEQALDEAGQARAKRYEEDLPFREKEILERRITNRAEQIAKDKDMSFNDALIAAGAAILKSPGTPGSLAWMGEDCRRLEQR